MPIPIPIPMPVLVGVLVGVLAAPGLAGCGGREGGEGGGGNGRAGGDGGDGGGTPFATAAQALSAGMGDGNGAGADPFGVAPLHPVRSGVADAVAAVNLADAARRSLLFPPRQPPDRSFRRRPAPEHRHPQPDSPPFVEALERLVPALPGGGGGADGGGPGAATPGPEGVPRPVGPSPAPARSFAGLGDDNTSIPPDTAGAVGPEHVMVALNTQVRVQDRGGAEVSTVALDDFWDELGADAFDPRLLYDAAEGRWIFVATANPGAATSAILVAASATSDPTGDWNLFTVDADPEDEVWADYPTVGFNRRWVAVNINAYTRGGNAFDHGALYLFDKADLYAADGAGRFTHLPLGGLGTVAPAVVHDPDAPDLPLLVTWHGNFQGHGFLRLYTVGGEVGAEVVTPGPFAAIDRTWDFMSAGGEEIGPQLGSAALLATNDARMQTIVQRNGRVYAAHAAFIPAGGAPTHTAVQWWEIDPTAVRNNVAAVRQFGRLGDAGRPEHFAFPSLSVNRNGDLLLGCSRMGPAQHASANYAFRAGDDPPGVLRDVETAKAGEAPYEKRFGGDTNRWGDYSATMVDPVDDERLWTLQMYAAARRDGFDRWGVWWAAVAAPEVAPVLDPVGDLAVDEGATLLATLSAHDANGDPLTFSARGLPADAALDPDTGELVWETGFDDAGEYAVTFTVSDGGLTDEEAVVVRVSDVNRPPVLHPVGDRQVPEGQVLALALRAADPDGDRVRYEAADLPRGATLDAESGALAWTPKHDQAGAYPIGVAATDGRGGRDEERLTITVIDVNRPPRLDVDGDLAGAEGAALLLTVSGSDPDGDPVSMSAPLLPAGAGFEPATGRFAWTPTYAQAGEHPVRFRASDGRLSAERAVLLAIGDVNRSPVAEEVGDVAAREGEPLEVLLRAADPDGDALSWGADALPAGATLDPATGLLAWTPGYDQAGAHAVAAWVSDGGRTTAVRFVVRVAHVNRPPRFEPPPSPLVVREDELLAVDLAGSDPDGDPLLYAVTGLPPAAAIDPATGALRWTPGFDDAGEYVAVFAVSDGALSDEVAAAVTVLHVNRRPSLRPLPDWGVREGGDLRVDVAAGASDPDGDALGFAAAGLPRGATLDPVTGLLSFTPGFDQAGIYAVRVRVSDGLLTDEKQGSITVVDVNRAPVLGPIPAAAGAEGAEVRVDVAAAAADPDGDWLTYGPGPAGLPAGAALDPATGVLVWTPGFDQAGDHVVGVRVSDGHLDDEGDVVISVANTDRPPRFDAAPEGGRASGREGEVLSIAVGASDPDGDAVVLVAVALPAGAALLPGPDPGAALLAWTPAHDQAGDHPASVRAIAGGLAADLDLVLSVADVNRPPTAVRPDDPVVREGEPLLVALAPDDPDGDSFVATLDAAPDGATLDPDTGDIVWTPTHDDAGDHTFLVVLDDGRPGGRTDVQWLVTVLDVNRPPALAPPGDLVVVAGETLAFTLAGTDPDGDRLAYAMEATPPLPARPAQHAARLDNISGRFEWRTAAGQVGAYVVTFYATDGELESSAVSTLAVGPANGPPQLEPIADVEARVGVEWVLPLDASDPDGDLLAARVARSDGARRPAGLTLDEATLTLRWTPARVHVGVHELTVTVSDGQAEASRTFTATVVGAAPPDPDGPDGPGDVDDGGVDRVAPPPPGGRGCACRTYASAPAIWRRR